MTGVRGRIAILMCAIGFLLMFHLLCDKNKQFGGWFSLRDESGRIISKEMDVFHEMDLNGSLLTMSEFAEERFRYRIKHMKQVCEREEVGGLWTKRDSTKYRNEWVRNDNFVIILKKSFLVCVLPKCGSSSWHWLARDMREPWSAERHFGWQDRQKNTELSQELIAEDGVRLLQDVNAFRAIVVRHPFAKMISGWNDKLDKSITYSSFVLEAYPLMQKYASGKDDKHVLTFEDLAKYVASYGDDVKNLDYHFMPMQSLCQPCLYPYNYIVKLEMLHLDEMWLKKKLNITKIPWEQKGNAYFSKHDNNPVYVIRSYFERVDKSIIRKLMKIYYYDFALFGYTFDVDTLTAGGFF